MWCRSCDQVAGGRLKPARTLSNGSRYVPCPKCCLALEPDRYGGLAEFMRKNRCVSPRGEK